MRTKCKVASAVCAALFAMAISSSAQADDAKCQDGVAKGSRNVGNQEQKKNRKCVKDGNGDVDGCVDTISPKAVIKQTKLQELFDPGGKCDPVPALGVNNGGTPAGEDAALGTADAAGDILRRVFGDPVDGIELDSKCHDKIAKRAGKKFDTQLKGGRGCVKDGAPLASQAAVDACITAGVNDAKAQGTVQPKLQADIEGQCGGVAPPGLEDGECATLADAALANCIGNIVDCEACEAMDNSSNGTVDCDIVDNGLNDNSCSSPPPVACPLAAGEYTQTQLAGGTLKVSGLAAFPFPSGGTIVQDVAAASQPTCVHDTVVPFPGGFSAPVFCIPALVFTVAVVQTGCGVGEIDSNTGSDYSVTEVGDTSSTTCGLTQACVNGTDSDLRVDVTVGGGPGCVGGGVNPAQAIVSVPVQTTTWQDQVFNCPDPDGVYDPGSDALITSFPQILDFTTDETSADFAELSGDADGCCIAGSGPASNLNPCTPGGAGPQTDVGTCLDLDGLDIAGVDVTTVAAGSIGSAGSPLFDLSFKTKLPNAATTSGPFLGTVCGSPPAINFTGTAMRCIDAP